MQANEAADATVAERLEFQFEISLDDILEARRFVRDTSTSVTPSRYSPHLPLILIMVVAIPAACFAAMEPLSASDIATAWDWVLKAGAWIAVAVLGYFALRLWGRHRLRRYLAEHPEYRNSRIVISRDAFAVQSGPQTTEMRWEGILRIVVSERHIYFFTAETGANFLPRRAIGDVDQTFRTVEWIRQLYHGPVTDKHGTQLIRLNMP